MRAVHGRKEVKMLYERVLLQTTETVEDGRGDRQ